MFIFINNMRTCHKPVKKEVFTTNIEHCYSILKDQFFVFYYIFYRALANIREFIESNIGIYNLYLQHNFIMSRTVLVVHYSVWNMSFRRPSSLLKFSNDFVRNLNVFFHSSTRKNYLNIQIHVNCWFKHLLFSSKFKIIQNVHWYTKLVLRNQFSKSTNKKNNLFLDYLISFCILRDN